MLIAMMTPEEFRRELEYHRTKADPPPASMFMACYQLLRLLETLTEPTDAMREAGAQRLVSWEDGCAWPDSWTPLQVAAARNEADRVWRSMALELMGSNACYTSNEPSNMLIDAEIQSHKGL